MFRAERPEGRRRLDTDPAVGIFGLTLFEYITAGYVLLLSFAILRVLSGVPHALRSPRRYWVHISWLLMALVFCVVTFLAFWSYHEVEWTTSLIVGALAIPAALYAYNSLLVPPDPSVVGSWRDYFFDVRVPLFSTGIVYIVTFIVSNQIALKASPLHPSQLTNYGYLAIYATGVATRRPLVHAILAIAFPFLFVLSAALSGVDTPDSWFREVH